MKNCKFSAKNSIVFAVLSVVLVFFTSCENFLNGTELKDQVDAAVEYANSPSFTIQIAADDGTGKFTIGEGDRSVKVTDKFKVGFQKKANYKFIKWTAVSKTDDTVSRAECVAFEDESAVETEVKVIKENEDIKIKPLCELTMDFVSCIPVNNTKSGIERNSQIELNFTNPLSENNDVEDIEITIEEDLKEPKSGKLYFQVPEIKGSKLIVRSKIDNLIPVEQGELKVVRITIPSDFKYIGAGGEEKEIGSEMSYYYTVNYQTCDKLHVVFGVTEDDGGKFKVQNVYDESVSLNYSLGEIDTVIFKPSSGFRFLGWEYEDDGHIQLNTEINELINGSTYENGYCLTDNSYAVKIEIFNSSNADTNFLFHAKVEKIPTANIQITSEYGKISPNGIANYKEGDKVNLFFTTDSDYQFISWRLVNRKTGEEIENQDYVKFEDEKEFNTNFTFEKADDNIDYLIEPYCELRPTVVSVSPLYDTDGVYRDRRITVMFDTFMDTSSIYYSKEELVKLKILSVNENLDSETLESGYTLLKDSSNNCYGYWDSTDTNSYHFKNIQITKRRNLNENLLQYYGAPYFDENDTSKIIIQSRKDNPPPAGTEILVTLSSEMCSSVGSLETKTNVLLGSKYKWSYYTNGRADSDPPVFNNIDVRFALANQNSYDNNSQKVSDSIENITETPKTGIPKYNHKPRNLWLKGNFSDNGSGPASLKWSITKINNKYYPISHDLEYLSGKIEGDDYHLDGNTVMIGKDSSSESKGVLIDYSTIKDEGLYRFSVTAADNNGCTATRNFYFVYDETPPANVPSISNSRTSAERETINWTKPATADFDHVIIKRYKNSVLKDTFTQSSENSTSYSFTGLENQQKYRYEICAVDYCGNESSIKTHQDDTPPSKLTIRYSEGRNGRVNVFFTTPDDVDYCKTTVSYGDSSNAQETISEATGRNVSSYRTFGGAKNGTTYYYYFRTYDYSGNCSSHVYLEEMGGAMPGMICYAPGNSSGNVFCSKNYWVDKNPIGYVCEGSNQSSVKIWDIREETGYCWGKTGCDPNSDTETGWNGSEDMNYADGMTWYKDIMMKKYSWVVDFTGYDVNGYLKSSPHTIWYYLERVKNVNSAVVWYIPSPGEFKYILDNYNAMKAPHSKLTSAGISATLVTSQQPYWTGVARFYDDYAFVGAFNTTIGGGLDWGSYHKNSDSDLKYFALTSNQREKGWYYKDRAVDVVSGTTAWWIRTHAMAIINMN